jgi:3-oxoacyl-[acyl-carrier protein] reductase
MDLRGRVALITGGGTGLGQAITLALAREGARVAVNYARSEAEAQATVAEARRLGAEAVAVRADVADQDAVAAMVATVARDFGRLDLLVNNAGITRYVPIEDLDSLRGEDFDRILAVNVKGAFLCAQLAARHMRATGAGKIVNVASDSAFSGRGSSIPYVVSKAGLVMLTRCLARALAPAVQVNAVAPGWLPTRWLATYLPPDKARQVLEDPRHPPVPLADVTQAVLLLARNDAITGQTLIIDGGVGLD